MNWQSIVESGENFLQNKYVSTILIVFFILYGSLVAPKLPHGIAKYLDYTLVRLVLFFVLAYLASGNPTVALIAALAVFISLQTLVRYQMAEHFVKESSMPAPTEETNDTYVARANQLDTAVKIDDADMVVTDHNEQPLTDEAGKPVVAKPTPVHDEKGEPVKDESGKLVVSPPKVAVTSDGKPAKDKEGKYVVAPPKVVTDESGVPVKNVEGNYMTVPCEVTIQDDGSIYVVDGAKHRAHQHGRAQGMYGVYQSEPTSEDKQVQDISMVCSGDGCFEGYDKGNDLASF